MNTYSKHHKPAMNAAWQVKIGPSVYGPYLKEKMSALISQGLLSPHSKVLRKGTDEWTNVAQDPDLRTLLGMEATKKDTRSVHDEPISELELEGANFALFIEMQAESNTDLYAAIRRLGPAKEMTKNFWVLNCARSAGSVRNALVPFMGKADTLFVIDASNNKTAWFNFGPEADSKIRQVWRHD